MSSMADTATILIVDDELPIRRFLVAGLNSAGFKTIEAETIKEALRHITTQNPDLILLDLGLPDGDGTTLVQQVREWSEIPIIILSARGLEADKVRALDLGANDYVTKPFGMSELLARIRVASRTARAAPGSETPTIQCGEISINFDTREVQKGGKVLHFTPLEYKLLTTLARNMNKVLTHKHLLTTVWGEAYARETQYLRVFMGQLRRKIEVDPARPKYLTTESGVGYRFRSNETIHS